MIETAKETKMCPASLNEGCVYISGAVDARGDADEVVCDGTRHEVASNSRTDVSEVVFSEGGALLFLLKTPPGALNCTSASFRGEISLTDLRRNAPEA
jgi:hypothetical protein